MKEGLQDKSTIHEKVIALRDLILIISPAFLCASFIFNFFYFYALEIPFEKIPLSTTDYIITVNAILPALFSIAIASVFNQIFAYITYKDAHIKLKTCNILSKEFKDIISTLDVIFIIMIIAIVIKTYNIKSIFFIKQSAVLLIVLSFIFIIDIYFKIDKKISRLAIISITTLAISVISAVELASKNYQSDTSVISISGNTYYVMRSFSSGFLLRVPNKHELIFLTTAGVKISFQQSEDFQNKLARK